MINHWEELLLNNKAWAKEKLEDDSNYFQRLSSHQSPKYLWVGCSDSRVPANEITGTDPGEMFVHRNIANVVVHTDLNLMSVLQYAVEVLKVEHIIVCGHYGCGGVNAAMTHQSYGLINKWLRNIKDVYRLHRNEIDVITDPVQKSNKLVELNVQEQVLNLAQTSIVQRAWKERNSPYLHGWIYSIQDGILHNLIEMPPNSTIDPIYTFHF
jgi:carbonic anhydrase